MGNQIARTACRTNILPGQGPAERNDRYLTPKHIVEALGPFDLDPCGAPGHVLAKNTYLLENGDDGLRDPWVDYYFFKNEKEACNCECHQNLFAPDAVYPSQPRRTFSLPSKSVRGVSPISVVSASVNATERGIGLTSLLSHLQDQKSLAPSVAQSILQPWSSLALTMPNETAWVVGAVNAFKTSLGQDKLLEDLTLKNEKLFKLKSKDTLGPPEVEQRSESTHAPTTTVADNGGKVSLGYGTTTTGSPLSSFGDFSAPTVEGEIPTFTKITSSRFPHLTAREQSLGISSLPVLPATSPKEAKILRSGQTEEWWTMLATILPSCTQCSTCMIAKNRLTTYVNPPYGRYQRPWIERLVEHGEGTALLPVATGTKLWQDVVWPNATAIHFYRHRIEFLRRKGFDGGEKMVSPQASAIIAFGDKDAEALVRSDLPGVVIDFR